MTKKVIVIGAFDTKGEEYKFLIDLLEEQECQVTTVNTGIFEPQKLFRINVPAAEVADAGGTSLSELREANDRGKAIAVMSDGAAHMIERMVLAEKFDGVIGMGGTAGTNIVTSAMRHLSYGLPKICLSTVASGDVSPYVGISDITMIPSLTDIAGINFLSKLRIRYAAGALIGMMGVAAGAATDKQVIGASMFGNTTPCVDLCRKSLNQKGFEVLVFHATGNGGRTMEKLVREGTIKGLLDITTTEWADSLCGGVFDAGKERLDAPGKMGIPHLIAPGCIDMCNFGNWDTVPGKYKDRLFYQWNPNVTLMRTTPAENKAMGEIFAQKANASKGKTVFLIPLRGFSMLDSVNNKGEPQLFWDPVADKSFITGLKSRLNPKIEIVEVDDNINSRSFADKAVELFLDIMK